jgi:hypothetical protein
MWKCNICFKTFDHSTSYYNHRKSHKFTNSEYETSSSESSMESLNEELCIKKKDNGNKTKDYNYYENEIEKSEYNLPIPEQDFSNEISADCISPVV